MNDDNETKTHRALKPQTKVPNFDNILFPQTVNTASAVVEFRLAF